MVGVGAVSVREGDILLVKRGGQPGQGKWAVPGGRVESGERLREAVVREVYEETGLRISVGAVAWQGEVHARTRTDAFHYVIIDFLATVTGGALRAGGDAADARWVTLEEARSLDLVPSMYDLLDVISGSTS